MTISTFLYKQTQRIARKMGFDIVRYAPTRYEPVKIEDQFSILEFVVHYYVASHASLNFIQIGANDGVRWDPLRDLILRYHLAGVLVEPLPDMFEQLKRNYEGESQLSFENSAIATQNGTRTLFRVHPDAHVPDYVHGWASFNKAHFREFTPHVYEVQVSTITVRALLQKYGITHVTLLQVDTEGYDNEILKMFFDERVFPEVINYEHAHLSNADKMECRRLLKASGYRFLEYSSWDTMAIRGSSLAGQLSAKKGRVP